MIDPKIREISYFPGCSLATSAHENNHSLVMFCRSRGVDLVELNDWNCCGSSSAHRLDSRLGLELPARNLALAPEGRPLLAACPSCYLRLKLAHLYIGQHEDETENYHATWGRPFDKSLEIISFFDLLSGMVDAGAFNEIPNSLNGLKFVPYYGCMLTRPPVMSDEPNFHGLMEKLLVRLGAVALPWRYASRCCGTFLSVTRPAVAARIVKLIVNDAEAAGAECIVTACAMCHLNLEIRSSMPGRIPILHFSELLSISVGIGAGQKTSGREWFRRHLTDPAPLLRRRGIIA